MKKRNAATCFSGMPANQLAAPCYELYGRTYPHRRRRRLTLLKLRRP